MRKDCLEAELKAKHTFGVQKGLFAAFFELSVPMMSHPRAQVGFFFGGNPSRFHLKNAIRMRQRRSLVGFKG